MIRLTNITKIYNEKKHNECVAVRDINIEIPDNSITVLCGPSGSGKTTLLSLLGVMVKPTSGRIFINNKEITSLPEKFLSKFRRENIGFVFQKINLLKNMTVIQNLLIPTLPTGISYKVAERKAYQLLEKFGLEKLANVKSECLSGGEAQRVAIARSLINNPFLIIADEPSANLDSSNTLNLLEIFRQLLIEGKTLVIASHDPLIYNSSIINLKIEMRDGKVVND